MFLKFRVKAAIAKFITMNGLHSDTLRFLNPAPLKALCHLSKRTALTQTKVPLL
jgi:hypothetical protein